MYTYYNNNNNNKYTNNRPYCNSLNVRTYDSKNASMGCVIRDGAGVLKNHRTEIRKVDRGHV